MVVLVGDGSCDVKGPVLCGIGAAKFGVLVEFNLEVGGDEGFVY